MRIWHFGFIADAARRGPSPTCDVFKNFERHLTSDLGNQTEKFPIEVEFDLLGLRVGDNLAAFKTGAGIRFGATLACLLIGHALTNMAKW